MDKHDPTQEIDPLPDHDFHSGWGCTYSARGTTNNDAQTRALWLQYLSNPTSIERQFHVLLGSYTDLFAEFFGSYYPISLHAHATDALFPTTIASLILNTVCTSPLILDSEELRPKANEAPKETGARVRNFSLALLGWTDAHIYAPNFVAVKGTYGAGFGPLACMSTEWETQAIATGPHPVVVDLKANPSQEDLDAQFAEAKAQGAIGILLDIVSTEDGSVLSPAQYAQLKLAAQRNQLLIIADETMSAIRCGAPFAFQRPEYNPASTDVQPDLVIFGKGLGISGVAIGFSGVLTHSFAYKRRADILQTILYWRAMVSRPVRLPVLIEALGVLRAAQAENWPARSTEIGRTVREILYELEPETKLPEAVRGLGAMIALHKDVAIRLRIQSAIRRRSPWVRWLPKLDRGLTDRELMLRHVFGKESAGRRGTLSKEAESLGTMPLWCFTCGIQATEEAWCRRCYLGVCRNEVCLETFQHHFCIGT